MATVGALMCLTIQVINFWTQAGPRIYPRMEPEILDRATLLFHAASFLSAAFLFRIRSLQTQTVLALDLLLFGLNILARSLATICIVETGDHFPGIEGISLAVILHGVFVPTGITIPIVLGALATISFPLAQIAGLHWFDSIAAHWQQVSGAEPFAFLLTLNTLTIAFFAFLGVLANRVFYGLARDAYRAKQLGNYLIEGELGSGGMGKILIGRHRLMRRPTAIKVLRAEFLGGPEALARFEREVELASKLTHPNTIAIYDFGRSADGTFYYAMEMLKGLNLQELVDQYGPLPSPRAVHIVKQICGSLAEAHSMGVVHRDIKPSNIFLTQRGGLDDFVKVIDFGLAKQVATPDVPGEGLTEAGRLFGTPHFMAPETAYGADRASPQSDIYSLGAVAYWLVTGKRLFDGTPAEILAAHVKTVPKPPSKVSEVQIPASLEQTILTCLKKKPEERHKSAMEIFTALDGIEGTSRWSNAQAREWWEIHHPGLFTHL